MAARLLVTGFGAFPGMPANPSELVVERLSARAWAPPGASLDYAVLPTTWEGAQTCLREHMQRVGAEGVLLTGVAGGAKAFRVELRARNLGCTHKPDANGVVRQDPRLTPGGPAVLRSTAPVEAMVYAIRAEGLPAELSSDAGDYLCNCTLYALLAERLDVRPAPPLAFLHMPPVDVLELDALERGVRAAAGVMARALAFAPRAT